MLEAGDGGGPRAVSDGGRQVENLEDTLHRGERLLHRVHHSSELAHRPVEKDDRRGEGEELARGERPADHPVAAVPDCAHDAHRAEDLHERLGEEIHALVLQGEAQEPIVDPVEALLLKALAPESLDDLVAGEGLLQHDVQLADLLLRSLGDLVQLPSERPEEHAHRGEDDHRDEGEHPLPDEHHGEEGHDGGELADGHDEHGGGEAGEAVDVVDHADHQLGRVHLRVERQRHALDVSIELAPDAGDHALAHRGHQVGLAVASHALDDVRAQEHERDELEHDEVPLQEDIVEGGLDQPGDEPLGAGHHEGEGAPDDEPMKIGPEIGPEPQEKAIGGLGRHQAGRRALRRRR